MQAQVAATTAVANAQASVDVAQAAVTAADEGPSKDELAAIATKDAREAFDVLRYVRLLDRDDDDATRRTAARKATDKLTVKHDGTGTTFASNDKPSPFAEADANKAPPIVGWHSATLKGKRRGNNAEGMAYSNIEAPTDELFAVRYNGQTTDISVLNEAGEAISTEDADVAKTNANWKRVKIPAASAYSGASNGGSIAGTYDGVEGTFTCMGTCPPSPKLFPLRTSSGAIIETDDETTQRPVGLWSFKATDKDATVKVTDEDYLSFGYWLSKNSEGTPRMFKVWYGATGAKTPLATVPALVALNEKVTYTGAAAGKYVVKDVIVNTAHAGYFTADAELTADFRAAATTVPRSGTTAGDATSGTPLPGFVATLSGSISGFKDGDSTPLGDLKLGLSGDLVAVADADDGVVTATVPSVAYDHDRDAGDDDASDETWGNRVTATSGGVKHGWSGTWEAEFSGKEKTTNLPTGVTGAFDATVGSGAIVVGGFAATK